VLSSLLFCIKKNSKIFRNKSVIEIIKLSHKTLKFPILVATAEDSDSPVAMKLKKMWLKTPVSEEQAAQAVLDPAIGNFNIFLIS
jgi:5'(3')-deoxyribonucleotidase